MIKNITIIFLIINTVNIIGQEKNTSVSIGSEIALLNNIKVEMVLDSYACVEHPEESYQIKEKCSICGINLLRDKKIKFYFQQNNEHLTAMDGKVIIIFKDGTQIVRKLKTNDSFSWVKLGNNSRKNYQQAILKLDENAIKSEVIFGKPINHNSHHH